MDILWLKVSDEVEVPGKLSETEQSRLAAVFDPANPASAWSRALKKLGMGQHGFAAIIRFVDGTPYFNGTALALASSHATVYPEDAKGVVTYRTRLGFVGLIRVLISQWKLEKFLFQASIASEPLEDSIALGLAIQALMMRLPSKSEAEVAVWLASPNECPPASRVTVKKILDLQSRRNALSNHWNSLFDPGEKSAANPSLPAHFWNEPPSLASLPVEEAPSAASNGQSWKGIPVCPGIVEGELQWVDANGFLNLSEDGAPSILCFARARPETTEHFSNASALIFAEGGALSHACSIARERGIPTVSGLGRTFAGAIQAWRKAGVRVHVRLNGGTGEVSCSPIAR